jgi:hypothetical protein
VQIYGRCLCQRTASRSWKLLTVMQLHVPFSSSLSWHLSYIHHFMLFTSPFCRSFKVLSPTTLSCANGRLYPHFVVPFFPYATLRTLPNDRPNATRLTTPDDDRWDIGTCRSHHLCVHACSPYRLLCRVRISANSLKS